MMRQSNSHLKKPNSLGTAISLPSFERGEAEKLYPLLERQRTRCGKNVCGVWQYGGGVVSLPLMSLTIVLVNRAMRWSGISAYRKVVRPRPGKSHGWSAITPGPPTFNLSPAAVSGAHTASGTSGGQRRCGDATSPILLMHLLMMRPRGFLGLRS